MNISAITTGLVLCASLLLSGCTVNGIAGSNVNLVGNEDKATVSKTVSIGDFNEIVASQGIKVIYVQGAGNGNAEISTTTSAEKYLKVEVRNKTLKAYYANTEGIKNVKIKGPTTIRVSSPRLCEVDLSSAAHLTIEGDLKVDGDFEIELSSAASLEAGTVSCRNLDANLSSSAKASISSLLGNLDTDVSSASSIGVNNMIGNINAEASSAASLNVGSVKTSVIVAEASSAASISIEGISGGNISASASSGAKVNLSGSAECLRKHASSGGSVNGSNLTVKQ